MGASKTGTPRGRTRAGRAREIQSARVAKEFRWRPSRQMGRIRPAAGGPKFQAQILIGRATQSSAIPGPRRAADDAPGQQVGGAGAGRPASRLEKAAICLRRRTMKANCTCRLRERPLNKWPGAVKLRPQMKFPPGPLTGDNLPHKQMGRPGRPGQRSAQTVCWPIKDVRSAAVKSRPRRTMAPICIRPSVGIGSSWARVYSLAEAVARGKLSRAAAAATRGRANRAFIDPTCPRRQ